MPEPFVSVVTPIYNPPAAALTEMLASVRAQTFADWEHCLVDDGSTEPQVREILDRAAAADDRVRVTYRDDNGGISRASNDGLNMAQGMFVALLDHDDLLHPDALQQVHDVLEEQPDVDYLYSDEDKIDEEGRHLRAFFKPDWSPDRLRTQMYTCHLSVLRRSLVDEVGGFDPDFDGSQDWDLVLRVTERARRVAHIPRVLYHWRMLEGSAAGASRAKPWTAEAGARAVQAHCDRTGFPAIVEPDTDPGRNGICHLRPRLPHVPPVSIVIPTAGTWREVRGEMCVLAVNCVRSVVETTTYDNYEIVCVVDDQIDPAILDALRTLAGDRLTIVRGEPPFNFAERVNLGVLRAKGEHLLLLNDDAEVITPDWIERLVMYSTQHGIGAVGAKLLFGDGRLQHVGVIFPTPVPTHIYRGFSREFSGHFGNTFVANNYLAVTGACLMTARDTYELVGGLSPLFPLNYNDVDYCLKVQAVDQRVVFDPDTMLYHYELSTRPAVVERWESEILERRWMSVIKHDPNVNPSLLEPTDLVRMTLVRSGGS